MLARSRCGANGRRRSGVDLFRCGFRLSLGLSRLSGRLLVLSGGLLLALRPATGVRSSSLLRFGGGALLGPCLCAFLSQG